MKHSNITGGLKAFFKAREAERKEKELLELSDKQEKEIISKIEVVVVETEPVVEEEIVEEIKEETVEQEEIQEEIVDSFTIVEKEPLQTSDYFIKRNKKNKKKKKFTEAS